MYPTLADNVTMKNTEYGKGKAHITPEGLQRYFCDQLIIDTGIHK